MQTFKKKNLFEQIFDTITERRKQLSVQFLFQNERIPVYTKLLQDNVCSPQHGARLLFFVPADLFCSRTVQQVTSESLLSQVKEMHKDPTDKLKS